MGKIQENTGTLSGLIGTVVSYSWKGLRIVRSAPRRSRKPRSAGQLEQQAKVSMLSKFVYSMKTLLDQTFIHFAIQKTGTNAAFSYNFKNGITGVYPSLSIIYSQVLVSRGDLHNATEPVAGFNAEGDLQFSWEDNSGTGQAKATDECICVAHCPDYNMTLFSIGTASRQTGTAVLNQVKHFKGKTVETWLAFRSANGKEFSDSIHTGKLAVH